METFASAPRNHAAWRLATSLSWLSRASSLLDFQAGREVEVESIWGEPLRRATAAGLTCPLLKQAYELIIGMVNDGKLAPGWDDLLHR